MSVVVLSVLYMIIDCETCTVRGPACGDCVVSFLTIPVRQPERTELDAAEQKAIAVLAAEGLIPPLRLQRHAG